MDNIIPQKQCNKCPRILPLTTEYFHVNKATKSGFKNHCKECDKIINKANKNKPDVKAKANARGREYARTHKEKRKEQRIAWYAKNRDYALEQDRQFRIDHPEILAQRWQNWAKTEQGYEHCRIRVRNRRVRRKGAQGNYTYADIRQLYTAQEGKCAYCGVDVQNVYHIDHVIPLSKGGSNYPSNLAISCPTCNLRKKDKLL